MLIMGGMKLDVEVWSLRWHAGKSAHGWVDTACCMLQHADKPAEFKHNDQGFTDRKSLLDLKTSTPVNN